MHRELAGRVNDVADERPAEIGGQRRPFALRHRKHIRRFRAHDRHPKLFFLSVIGVLIVRQTCGALPPCRQRLVALHSIGKILGQRRRKKNRAIGIQMHSVALVIFCG